MKHARLLRIISFVLAFIMLLEIGPIHAFGMEMPMEEEMPDIPMPEIIEDEVAEIPEVYIDGEVTELRNEYEKHYRLTDGSFMAVQYQVPVHYEDDGQWVDIDNTLEAVTMFSGDTVYQAVNGENVQAFASDLSDGTIMTMATDDHMISMSIWTYDSVEEAVIEDELENSDVGEDDAVETEPEASNPDTDLVGDAVLAEEEWTVMADVSLDAAENIQEDATVEEQQDDIIVAQILTEEVGENPVADTEETEPWVLDDVMPDALSSSILYEDVFPGVDLRYDTFSYNVKESIILKQPMDLDEYSYSFLLTLDGLEPELQEDGSILLFDDAYEVQYTIPAPYMWDSENVYSDAVFYELEENDNGWVLTVCADENWMEDDKRAYPVTIDPSINIDNGIKYTTSVQTGTPNSNSDAARPGRMSCGYSTNFGKMIGYAQIPTLPTLPIGSTVIAAKFKPISASHWLATNCRMDIYMLKTQVADEYWNGIIPWTQQPEVKGSAMDFVVASQKTNVDISPGSWDITPAFMQWMEDPETNFGLKAVGVPAQNNKNAFIRFDKDKSYITVTYRNTVGTESYYTYETQSAVRAGTGYVGDFSSALTVIKTDVSYSSTTIPFSVSHVYNSGLAGKEISAYRENEGILAPDYSKMKTGNGWQMSVQESVVQKYINGDNRQVYRDGDGTLHYFNWVSGSTYVDEDGLGLTLRQYADGGDKDRSYEIKDQQGNIRFFRNNMISYIADANGNRIYFIYNVADYNATTTDWYPNASSNNKLTKIVAVNDGKSNSDICTFGYVGDRLTTITDYANRVTRFAYDDAGNLESITHPDGTMAKYTYDNSGRLTSMCDIEAEYGIAYEYDTDGISGFFEYTIDENNNMESEGTHVRRSKPSIQEAEYRYDGNDRAFYSDDDIVNRYVFDYNGRTINAVTLNSNQNRILGVTAAAYKASSAENPAANNRISKTGQSGQNGVNLLKNSGMEYENGSSSDLDWDSLTVNQSNYSGEFSDVSRRTGQNALKTTINNSAAPNYNDARRAGMYQDVTLKPGTTYTFSAYVNTNDVTNFSTGSIYAAFLNSDKAVLKAGNKITYKTDAQINGGWQRVYCTYTTGSTEESLYVAVIQENAFGTVYYDDLQLEIGDAPSTVNLLQNATFDQGKTHWSGENFNPDTNDTDEFHTNVLTVDGSPTAYLKSSQQIQIEQVCTDQTFLLSGWGKAASAADCKTEFSWETSAEINTEHGKRFFGLIAKCRYTKDGTRYTDYHYMPFNDDFDEWQFASCIIVPKSDYQEQGMILNYIEVYIVYDKNFNTMMVDNLSLRQEPCTTYTYNKDGNVVGTTATGNESASVEYMSDNVRPKKVWKSETEVYRYQYNESNKYLPTIIRNDNTKVYTKYHYDNCGNIKEMEIGKLNSNNEITDNPKLISKTTYSPDGSQIKEVTNANGQKTKYEYSNRRNLQETIDINGTSVVSIENTLNDRPVTSYIDGVVSVGYSYNGGLLSRITRGGFITGNSVKQNQFYNMTYDDFGNMTKVSIGGTNDVAADSYVLVTYNYGDANGHLNSMTYGNGDNINYYYDELDRVTEEVWDDGTSYKYFYNSEGALSKKVDTTTGNTVNYEYDSIGRLIHSSTSSWNAGKQENEIDMLTEHLYDRQNRVKEQSYQIRNSDEIFTTYSQKYTYRGSDGLLTNVESKYRTTDGSTDNALLTYSLEYDELARLEQRTNSYFTQTYGYRANGSDTTTQIESIIYDKGTAGSEFTKFTLTYGYDALGNIETITNSKNPSDKRTYTYDIQGQLLSETFGPEGNSTTNSYTYDTYGNIRTATVNGTTHTYTYDDANWKDKLTAYDGCPIPYDEIGNPLGYNNGKEWWSFRWSNGRQLASAMSENRIITYTYDMAGIRDSKTVDGITYRYDTLNGKVVRQTWTQNGKEKVFDIIYDAGGQPYACVYEGYRYYYVLNQQGDVIQIVGYEGTVCAEYRYDAWGNVLEIGGMYDETLGAVNPIRYRGYYYDTETGFYYLQSRYYDPSIGRFINVDNFASTGQGFLGYNMFAYCNNNPVCCSDPSGNAPETIIFPVCIGGGGKAVSAQSDHEEDSDKLLDYVQGNYLPYTSSTVYINVEHQGTYTHTVDNRVSQGLSALGIASIAIPYFFPGVKAYGMLAKALKWGGTASTLYGITTFSPPNELQNRDYSQYRVTITWSETNHVIGYPNALLTTNYSLEMWFLLDDDDWSNTYWYLQSSNMQEVRKITNIN